MLLTEQVAGTRLWTRDEYWRLIEHEIISPEEKVELVMGEVITMASKKPPHTMVTEEANEYFRVLLLGRAHVRVQEPLVLSENSEPEPDIALVLPPRRRYMQYHPTPREVFLVIEIADATLKIDVTKKARMYAQARIADYWVINVITQSVIVFREPVDGRYTQKTVCYRSETIAPLSFPDTEVKVSVFFP